jgi:hypothetical protein
VAEEGAEFVIARHRGFNANLRTQLDRFIARAGLEPWQKRFQNLRSTRETELVEMGYPLHVVCKWIGNSEPVAAKHYLQVTDEHFRRAIAGDGLGAFRPGAGTEKTAEERHLGNSTEGKKAAQNQAQQPQETAEIDPQPPEIKKPQGPELAGTCGSIRYKSSNCNDLQIPPGGVEPPFTD